MVRQVFEDGKIIEKESCSPCVTLSYIGCLRTYLVILESINIIFINNFNTFFLEISSDAGQRKLRNMLKIVALEIHVKTVASLSAVNAVYINTRYDFTRRDYKSFVIILG
jgi:hypothetical protein